MHIGFLLDTHAFTLGRESQKRVEKNVTRRTANQQRL
jgi:hypothetical protein